MIGGCGAAASSARRVLAVDEAGQRHSAPLYRVAAFGQAIEAVAAVVCRRHSARDRRTVECCASERHRDTANAGFTGTGLSAIVVQIAIHDASDG